MTNARETEACDAETPRLERLHKFLASTGAGSRRECETFITQGRVSVNGKIVTRLGTKIDPVADKVKLDGESVKAEDKVYWILHKPLGTICTNSDEMGRIRVVDLVPDRKHRIYTVGRLDADSIGLILLTNDGAIANVICHPRYRIHKVYHVAVRGRVTREQIAKIEAGVWLAEGKSSPAKVRAVGFNPKRNESLVEMTVFEGRNREIRRVLARVGLVVRRLLRSEIGPLKLGKLPPGGSRRLDPDELTFVHEAEALYLANREVWDAELPREKKSRPRPQGGPRGKGDSRKPRPAAAVKRFDERRPSGGSSTRSSTGRSSSDRTSSGTERGAQETPARRPRRYYE